MRASETKRPGRRAKVCAVLLVLVAALLIAIPAIASAATITVTNYSDVVDGDTTNASTLGLSPGVTGVSLREAVMAANGEGLPTTIVLAPGTYVLAGPQATVNSGGHSATVYGGSIDVSASITIAGAGSTITVDQGVPRRDRIFDVAPAPAASAALQLANVTLSQGHAEDALGGGAIRAGSGASGTTVLELIDCVLSGNTATEAITAPGGALAIGNDVALTLTRCTFDGNTAKGVGGAIFISDSGAGSVSARECTFTANVSDGTTVTAGQGGAIYANAGSNGATLTASTLTGNVATSDGKHGHDMGGALFLGSGWTVRDCRIVGASADETSTAHGFSGTPKLEYNWWATNGDPISPTATAKVTGGADATPWIPLTVTSAPATIPAGGSTALTSRITTAGHAPPVQGMSVGFGGGTYGTVSPTNATWAAATANSTFNAGAAGGPSVVSAVFDGVTSTTTVNVTHSPEKFTARDVTFTVGTARTETFTADGWPLPMLSMTGTLPTSLAFTYRGAVAETTAAGRLAGTPVVGDGGRYPVTLVATNGVGPGTSVAINVTVLEKPRLVSAAEITVTAGSYGSFDVSATGFPVAQLSHLGALPSGLTLADHGDGTGAIAGVPDGPGGTFTVVLRANNGVGGPTDQTLTIRVQRASEKLTARDVTFTVGAAQTETFTADGWPLPTLDLSGVLPSGLTTAGAGSVGATTSALTLSGTPGAGTGGIYPLWLSAGNGIGADAGAAVRLTVVQAPSIVATSEATVTAGQPVSLSIDTSGYPAPALSVTGALPGGLSFADNGDGTGAFSGTLGRKTGGVYPVTVHAANGVAPSASHDMTITVLQAKPEWSYRQFTWDLQEDFEYNANTTDETVTVDGMANTTARPGGVVRSVVTALSAGGYHTVGLMSDGTVVSTGYNGYGQCDTSTWTSVTALAAGGSHTVGLMSDGRVVAIGANNYGQCDTSTWTSVTALAAGRQHTVGLKSDGTVFATGDPNYGMCNTSTWTSVTALAAGGSHTVGLMSDGTVISTGLNNLGQCNTSTWTSVTALAAGGYHTVGLKSDGTVVSTGNNVSGQCDTSTWTSVTALAAGWEHTVGLKSDGTVVSTGRNNYGQRNTSTWTSVTALAAGTNYTVGLMSNGRVVATGENNAGQCNTGAFVQGTLGGPGAAVGLRAVAGDDITGWDRLTSATSTLTAGQSFKYGIRMSGDGLIWSEVLGADGLPIDWTTGTGNYLGRTYGDPERTDLSALGKSRYIDVVVRMESSQWTDLELMEVSVTYDRGDTSPPSVTDDASAGWLTAGTTVTITATDTVAGVAALDVAVDGAGTPVTLLATETATVAVSAEGTTTIEYSAIDDAGNRCATETASVRIDKTAPDLSIIASPSQVSLVASDSVSGLSGVWYRIDGGAPQLYTGVPFSPGGSGHHVISAWTLDVAGNLTVEVANVLVDTVSPDVWDDAPAGWRTSDVTVTLSASDSFSAIGSLDWALSGSSADAGSVATRTVNVPVTAEGSTTVDYSAADAAGNRCATETATVRIDKTAPSTTATHAIGWVDGPVTVTLQSTDTVSGVDSIWYRTAPAGAWQPYSGAFTVTQPGTTTVTFWSVDVAGNAEPPQTTMVLVDHVDPVVSDDAPVGWQTADFAVTLSATDAHSGVAALDYDVTGAGGPVSGSTAGAPALIAMTAEGTTTVEYSAVDVAGNRCATEAAVVRLDKTAPSTTATHSVGWSQAPVTVMLASDDAHSGIASTWYRIGDGGNTLYSAPFVVNGAGDTTVTFWSVDVAGNTEPEKTTLVHVDPSAPTVSDDVLDAWQHDDVTMTITAADSISGVAAIDYVMSGAGGPGSGTAAGATAAILVTVEGTTTIEYSATDASGRRSATETTQVRIDRAAPSSTARYAVGWSGGPVTVTLEATDAVSGAASTWYRTASGSTKPYSSPFTIASSGQTSVSFWSVDVAGNVEDEQTLVVGVDTDVPIAADDAPDSWRATDVTVALSARDADAGIASIDWALLGASSGAGSSRSNRVEVVVATEGTTTIEYSAADAVGNRCATQTAVVRIDRGYPTVELTDSASVSYLASFVISGIDALSGVERLSWRIGEEPTQTASGAQVSVSYPVPGSHSIRYWATDAAGNQSAPAWHAFTVTGPSEIQMSSGSATLAAYGSRFRLSGTFISGGTPAAGVAVIMQSSTDGVRYKDTSVTSTTAADGTFALSTVPWVKTVYRVRAIAEPGVAGAVGPAVYALPRALVGTPSTRDSMRAGYGYWVRGTLRPRHTSGSKVVRVYAWRWEGGRWKSYGYRWAKVTDYRAYSRYEVVYFPKQAGRWRIRALHADSGHAASWSKGYDYFRVY